MRKISFLLVLLSLLFFLFYGLGDAIFFGKSTTARVIPFVLIFLVVPIFVYLNLNEYIRSALASKLTALSILLMGIAFGLRSKYLSENDFKKYGSFTYGKVIYREWSSINNRGRWNITAMFKYNDRFYKTFSTEDDENQYELNDVVRIHFSTRNPENNAIVID